MNATTTLDRISILRLAFDGLDDNELQEMAELTRLCVYPPNHVLCHEGVYEEVFYIIASGDVAITKHIGEDEGERLLRVAGSGDLVGEMSLIQNAPRSATVRTVSECTVLEMGKHDFETMLSRSPRVGMNIIRTTLDRLRENDQLAIRDLQASNKVLRQLDRNKMEFIQVAAHELRTPLTVLKGYLNLLGSSLEVKGNPSLEVIMAGVLKGTERMHEVVNMMLDVTRMDVDSVKIAAVPVPLKRILTDLVNDFQVAAKERSIEIVLENDPNVSTVNGDPVLLQKALYHLIVNAIKYTPDGGKVLVTTHSVLMEDGVPGFEVVVKDTGIGLNVEHHNLVFEKFYQVGSVAIHSSGKTAFKGGGPGLGLAIVRGVARAHGGKVWVESTGYDEVNYPGCTFYFRIPIDPIRT